MSESGEAYAGSVGGAGAECCHCSGAPPTPCRQGRAADACGWKIENQQESQLSLRLNISWYPNRV